MTQADGVHSTPRTDSPTAVPGSPADSAGELYFKTDVSPEEIFQAIGRLRKDARDEIDRLVRFLDKTDDYVARELEDEGAQCEGEGEQCEDEGAVTGDDEPSLGSLESPCCATGYFPGPNPSGDQSKWGDSSRNDREVDGAESGIGDHDGLLEQVGTQDWQHGGMF